MGLPEQVDEADAKAILESLPRSVHSLGLWSPRLGRTELRPELFVDDRLAWLDLSWWLPTPHGLAALFAALEKTVRVRVRLPAITGVVPLAIEPRLVLGDAGFLAEGQGACVLPRWPLRLLQRHHGIVGVRAQLGRLVAERYDLDHPEAGRLGASFKEGNALVRHGSGEWTARSSHSLPLRKNGLALATAALPVPLRDGDTLHIGGDPTPWRFMSRGLNEAFHRALSATPAREVAVPGLPG